MSTEIKRAVDELHTQFEAFKQKHFEVAKEEAKGYVDPLLKSHEERLNAAVTRAEEAVEAAQQAQLATKRVASIEEARDQLSPEQRELKSAFTGFIRRGEERLANKDIDLLKLHTKSLSAGSDPKGGYTVISEFDQNLIRALHDTSLVRQVASSRQIGTDQYERLVTLDLPDSGWVAETDSRPETDTPSFKKISIKVHEQYANPGITQQLIDDSTLDIEQELQTSLAEQFRLKENDAFVNGDGIGKPRGFMTYPAGTGWGEIEQIPSLADDHVTADSLIDLVYSLQSGYLPRAVFMMRRSTISALRKLKDNQNNFLWSPGLSGEPSTILGHPVYSAEDMPTIAPSSLPIIFGDFSQSYLILDRLGSTVLRDRYTNKPYVMFYTIKRVGGDVLNFHALKILKVGETLKAKSARGK